MLAVARTRGVAVGCILITLFALNPVLVDFFLTRERTIAGEDDKIDSVLLGREAKLLQRLEKFPTHLNGLVGPHDPGIDEHQVIGDKMIW